MNLGPPGHNADARSFLPQGGTRMYIGLGTILIIILLILLLR